MKNSQQHLGNEANLATFSLSHDVIFLMVSPLLGRFLVSFNLQSAICGLQAAVCKCHTPVLRTLACSKVGGNRGNEGTRSKKQENEKEMCLMFFSMRRHYTQHFDVWGLSLDFFQRGLSL